MKDPPSVGDQRVEGDGVDEATKDAENANATGGVDDGRGADSDSSGRTLRSPPDQVDSGSVWNSPFINLDFRRFRAVVVLREELSVHHLTKLTVVPFGTPRSSTWIFVDSELVLREELSVHRLIKLTVVPFGTLRSST
ncbi:hypothetical protein LR48_Vigan01g118300 [Vigna angularis]|uniref:Uncharacterized protein n=1 Tax=Phaseolus angularis TaxID=3914 RepID=A0A0L9TM03_PHAAN|nr:hypothetical protein LR48_Vigan01g118300 [Vigna angularis]